MQNGSCATTIILRVYQERVWCMREKALESWEQLEEGHSCRMVGGEMGQPERKYS